MTPRNREIDRIDNLHMRAPGRRMGEQPWTTKVLQTKMWRNMAEHLPATEVVIQSMSGRRGWYT